MISIIAPSRGRPQKSFETISKWIKKAGTTDLEVILTIDKSDISFHEYLDTYIHAPFKYGVVVNETDSSVLAINYAAIKSKGDILIVVSDDQEPAPSWATKILRYTEGRKDWVLKVQDGIQPKMITQPIMDRVYFQRDGWIYHPRFKHCFADQFLTDLAHKRKRVITKNIMFRHNHYSVTKSKFRDAQYERSDATFNEGRQIYKELKKEYGL